MMTKDHSLKTTTNLHKIIKNIPPTKSIIIGENRFNRSLKKDSIVSVDHYLPQIV